MVRRSSMKSKMKKILCLALIAFLCLAVLSTSDASGSTVKSQFGGTTNPTGSAAAIQILSAVLSIVRTAGAGVAVVMLMTIAAKYIMASAGDRADIKKYAVNYVIGALILFGATGILGVVQNFVKASVK